MTVATRKGDAGLADILFSRIVRSRGFCEYPGCKSQGPYVTAHVIGRGASGVRCVEDNAWCMCATHHALVDNWHDEKAMLVAQTIGDDRYRELRAIAEGYKRLPVTSKLWWADEVERLKARCRELGLSDRRAA